MFKPEELISYCNDYLLSGDDVSSLHFYSLDDVLLYFSYTLRLISPEQFISMIDAPSSVVRNSFLRLMKKKYIKAQAVDDIPGIRKLYLTTTAGYQHLLDSVPSLEDIRRTSGNKGVFFHDYLLSTSMLSCFFNHNTRSVIQREYALQYSSSAIDPKKHMVRADGLLIYENGMRYIEADTGGENLGVLINKIYRYFYIELLTGCAYLDPTALKNAAILLSFRRKSTLSLPYPKQIENYLAVWKRFCKENRTGVPFDEFNRILSELHYSLCTGSSENELTAECRFLCRCMASVCDETDPGKIAKKISYFKYTASALSIVDQKWLDDMAVSSYSPAAICERFMEYAREREQSRFSNERVDHIKKALALAFTGQNDDPEKNVVISGFLRGYRVFWTPYHSIAKYNSVNFHDVPGYYDSILDHLSDYYPDLSDERQLFLCDNKNGHITDSYREPLALANCHSLPNGVLAIEDISSDVGGFVRGLYALYALSDRCNLTLIMASSNASDLLFFASFINDPFALGRLENMADGRRKGFSQSGSGLRFYFILKDSSSDSPRGKLITFNEKKELIRV